MDDTTNDAQPSPAHISPFERIRQSEDEREFWRARDLAEVLGYTRWENFDQAIGRALRACRNSGAAPLAVERLTYHALLAGLQALLAEDYAGALTIAAAPAFIALLRQSEDAADQEPSGCVNTLSHCATRFAVS